jgi:hypothetical protein
MQKIALTHLSVICSMILVSCGEKHSDFSPTDRPQANEAFDPWADFESQSLTQQTLIVSGHLPVHLPLLTENSTTKAEELVVRAFVDAAFERRSELAQFKRGPNFYNVFSGWTWSKSERKSVSELASIGHSINVSRAGLSVGIDLGLLPNPDKQDLAKLVGLAFDLGIKASRFRSTLGTQFFLLADYSFVNLQDGLKLVGDLQSLLAKSEDLVKKIKDCPAGTEFMAEVKRTQIEVSVISLRPSSTDPIKLSNYGDFQQIDAVPELLFTEDFCRTVADISKSLKLLKL